jgi:diacylglycerol kinase family enzyme
LIHVIVNGAGGSFGDADARARFTAGVERIVPQARLTTTAPGAAIGAVVSDVVRQGATVVAAAGGDGTVNAVASALVGTNAALGVIPMGTLNHFAKDLGLPLETDAALGVLTSGRAVAVDVGQVNDRFFVNNSGLGLYPEMVFNREQRQKAGASKWHAAFIESVRALVRYRRLRLDIEVNGQQRRRHTAAVFVGNNEYSLDATLTAERRSLVGGHLCLYVAHPENRMRLGWLAIRALFGNPRADHEFDKLISDRFTILSRHRRVLVSLDGEVTTLVPQLVYRSRPLALRVMVPADHEAPGADHRTGN